MTDLAFLCSVISTLLSLLTHAVNFSSNSETELQLEIQPLSRDQSDWRETLNERLARETLFADKVLDWMN